MSGLELRRPQSRLALLFIAGALLAAFSVRSETARAHFQSGEWSHDNNQCNYMTTRQDPITLIFYEWGYADRSNDSVKYHLGWGNGDLGQNFASHGNCPATSHAASGSGPLIGQYHIRIKKTTETDGNPYNHTSAATPHREQACPGHLGGGHGVYPNGFVEAREYIIDSIYWREGHAWGGYSWWGNTDLREPECQSYWASTDGNVGWLVQHYSFHS